METTITALSKRLKRSAELLGTVQHPHPCADPQGSLETKSGCHTSVATFSDDALAFILLKAQICAQVPKWLCSRYAFLRLVGSHAPYLITNALLYLHPLQASNKLQRRL